MQLPSGLVLRQRRSRAISSKFCSVEWHSREHIFRAWPGCGRNPRDIDGGNRALDGWHGNVLHRLIACLGESFRRGLAYCLHDLLCAPHCGIPLSRLMVDGCFPGCESFPLMVNRQARAIPCGLGTGRLFDHTIKTADMHDIRRPQPVPRILAGWGIVGIAALIGPPAIRTDTVCFDWHLFDCA